MVIEASLFVTPQPTLDGLCGAREPLSLGLEREATGRGECVVASLATTFEIRLPRRDERFGDRPLE